MADETLLNLLKQSTNKWNQWRRENPEAKINLREAHLSGAKLSRANLSRADLSGADLSGANLRRAYLNKATLSKANLIGADFSEAYLSGAYLSGAYLSGAYLSVAYLSKADLSGAYLSKADLSGANLRRAYLSKAHLSEANLSGANLSRANLSKADLSATQALETNFKEAKLTGACIQDWNINSETNIKQVDCDYIFLKHNYLENKFTERRPHNPNKNFKPGEFTKLFQKALETVDLIFKDGIEWTAFFESFQQLRAEVNSAQLSIQAIEKKPGGTFVIRVEVPAESNKAEIEKYLKQEYDSRLKLIGESYQKQLQAKDEKIIEVYRGKSTDLLEMARIMASIQKPPINIEATGNKFMPEASQQNVTQNIGTNTGQAQAIAAGRDVNATQQMTPSEEASEITQEQAVEILTKIEELIKAANLPSEVVEEAAKYAGRAKEEASEKEPQQSIVLSQLDRATSVIKKLDTTAGTTKELIGKLKPLFVKLAGWLSVAASHFFG